MLGLGIKRASRGFFIFIYASDAACRCVTNNNNNNKAIYIIHHIQINTQNERQ